MRLLLKFNLIFLLVFVAGLAAISQVSWTLLERNARDEIAQSARLLMDAAHRHAHLHLRAGGSAAANADEVHLPAADGAGVLRHRGVQRPAPEAHRVLVQGGGAQPDQPAQPRGGMGDRHRQPVPQQQGQQRDHRRPRHAHRPLVLRGASAARRCAHLPAVPQHGRRRAGHDDRALRPGQRLRLDLERSDRRADHLGAHRACRSIARSRPSRCS